jgi:hypothetical protein
MTAYRDEDDSIEPLVLDLSLSGLAVLFGGVIALLVIRPFLWALKGLMPHHTTPPMHPRRPGEKGVIHRRRNAA